MKVRALPICLTCVCLFLVSGCKKKDPAAKASAAPSAGPKQPSITPVKTAKIKTPRSNAVKSIPSSQPSPTSQPGALRQGYSLQEVKTQPSAGSQGQISGTISISDELKSKVRSGTHLFIIVRRDAGEGQKGMLVAAKKVVIKNGATFPYAYSVGPQDVMMKGTAFAGQMRIEARIDQDGDAISKQPGDLIGALNAVSQVGSSQQDFTLETAL